MHIAKKCNVCRRHPLPATTPPSQLSKGHPFWARLGLSSSLESVSWPDDAGIKCAKITLQLCGVRDVLLKNYGSGNFRLASESLPPTLACVSLSLSLFHCLMPSLATSLSSHCSCFMAMLKLPKLQSLCVLLGYYDRSGRGSSCCECIRVCV